MCIFWCALEGMLVTCLHMKKQNLQLHQDLRHHARSMLVSYRREARVTHELVGP